MTKHSTFTKILAGFLAITHIFVFVLHDLSFAEEPQVAESTEAVEPNSSNVPSLQPSSEGLTTRSVSALSGSPDAVMPPMSAFQSFRVEPSTGMAFNSIPIAVPAGTHGFQPNIAINYASGSGNDICGVGWSFNLGYIERSTKDGVPAYNDAEDIFIFYSPGGTVELVPIGGGEYRAKLEGAFMRFKYDGSYWQVWDKSGTKYEFGLDDHTRISNGSRIFRWALKQVLDVYGNYMGISYLQDGNQLYPENILYGAQFQSDFLPVYSVNLHYEDRTDKIITYRQGSDIGKIITQKRLKDIEINLFNQPSPSRLIRRYVFEYTQSSKTQRSLLTKVTQYGSDGSTALPPTIFKYQDDAVTYTYRSTEGTVGDKLWNVRWAAKDMGHENFGPIPPNFGVPWGPTITQASYSDPSKWFRIDADGNLHLGALKDIFFHAWTYLYVRENTTFTIPAINSGDCVSAYFLNGDWTKVYGWGQPVNLQAGYNLLEITGYHQHKDFGFDLNLGIANKVDFMNSSQLIIPQLSADFNGDGRTDLGRFLSSSGSWQVALSRGTDFLPEAGWISSFDIYWAPLIGDFDGNGRIDACVFSKANGEWKVALSNGVDSFTSRSTWLSNFGGEDAKLIMGDFNGDGKQDAGYFIEAAGQWYIAISEGDHFQSPSVWISDFRRGHKPLTGDFNGDGLTDICAFNNPGGAWYVAINNPREGFEQYYTPWATGFAVNNENEIFTIDYNQDGLTDIGYFDKANAKLVVMRSTGEAFVESVDWITGISLTDPNIQVQFGDFNGDGILEPYFYNPYTDKTQQGISGARSADLLSYIDNGIGAKVSIEYLPSTAYSNLNDNNVPTLPCVIQTVKSTSIEDGLGNPMITTYEYAGGLYDTEEKELRGFRFVRTKDAQGTYTDSQFHQDSIFKGRPFKTETFDKEGNLFTRISNTWKSKEIHIGCKDNFVYLSKEVAYSFDGNPNNTPKTTRIDYDYDDWGNLIEAVNHGETDSTETDTPEYIKDNTKQIIEYASVNESDWLIGLPAHITVYDYTFTNKVSEKWLYYDNHTNPSEMPNKGLLTKEEIWLKNPLTQEEKRISTTYGYGSYGMLIRATDSKGNSALTSYDDFDENNNGIIDNDEKTYHLYPRKVSNGLGHTLRYHYDIKTGQILKSTDPNGQITRTEYDALGRPINVIGPLDTEENPGIIYDYHFPVPNLLQNGSFESWSNGANSTPDNWVLPPAPISQESANSIMGNYSAKMTFNSGMGGYGYFSYDSTFPYLKGKTITFGAWIKTSVANQVRTRIFDGLDSPRHSPYHPGDGKWHFLTVTHTVNPQAPTVFIELLFETPGEFYIDGAVLVEGNEIGELLYKVTTKQKINYDNPPVYQTAYQFYDGLGRLIQTKRPAQDETKQIISGKTVFDSRGNVKEKFLPVLADKSEQFDPTQGSPYKATFEYDALGRLIKTINPDLTFTSIQYDQWSTAAIDENGHKKASYSDVFGRLIKIEEYAGDSQSGYNLYATTKYTYDVQGNLIEVEDTLGNKTQLTYDSLGRKIKMDDPDMGVWEYKYDDLGNLIEQKDAKGQALQFTYDNINRLTRKQQLSPYSLVLSTYFYDDTSKPNCIGRLSKITDQSGSTEFFYDNLGREVKSAKTVTASTYTVERTYDALDRLVTLKYPDNSIIKYEYNPQGIEKTYNLSPTTYDLIKNIDYSPTGQITKITYGNGAETTYAYDPKTLRLTNLITQSPQGKVQDLNYQFDNTGNIKQIQDLAHNSVQSFQYDELSRLIQAEGNYGTLNYSYDQIGNLLKKGNLTLNYDKTNGAGPHAVSSILGGKYSTPNLLPNHSFESWSNGTSFENPQDGAPDGWQFSGNGYPTLKRDSDNKYSGNYSACISVPSNPWAYLGYMYYDYLPSTTPIPAEYIGKTYTFSCWVKTGIKDKARLELLFNTDLGSNWSQYHSGSGEWELLTVTATVPANANYFRVSCFAERDRGDETTTTAYFDNALLCKGDKYIPPLDLYYDANGNLIQKQDQFFTYDIENRLTDAVSPDLSTHSVNLNLKTGWNFFSLPVQTADTSIGNIFSSILSKIKQISYFDETKGEFKHFVNDSDYNQFDRLEYGRGYQVYVTADCSLTIQGNAGAEARALKAGWNLIGSTPDELSKQDALSNVSYDRLLGFDKTNSTLKDANTLIPGQAYYIHCLAESTWNIPFKRFTTAFLYDGDGGRVKKIVGSRSTTYIGSLYEVESDGTTQKHIFAGAQRICTQTYNLSPTTYDLHYYHSDHLGSSNVLTDKDGNQISYTEYKPYGETYLHQGTYDTPYKFTGKELDDSTGLYFYGARYYDPIIGRFITADTIVQAPYDPQSLNRYSHCRNNPINYVDPTGHLWWWVVPAIIGAIIGGVSSGIQSDWNPNAVLAGACIGAVSGVVGFGAAGATSQIFGKVGSAMFGGMIGGASAGLLSSAYYGGDLLRGTLMGAGLGALGGLAFGALSQIDVTNLASAFTKVSLYAVSGGGLSELGGGEFWQGAVLAGTVAMSEVVYRAVLSTNENGRKNLNPSMETAKGKAKPKLNADGTVKTVIHNDGSSEVGMAYGPNTETGLFHENSKLMQWIGKNIPLIQPTALLHDPVTHFYGRTPIGFTNGLIFNIPSMPVAFAITALGSAAATAYSPILGQFAIYGED